MDVPLLPATFGLLMERPDTVLGWDMGPVYRNYRTVLQLLSFQETKQQQQQGAAAPPPRRWILKSPGHLGHVKSLRDAFPGAKIVWTHRDPRQSMPSLCSLFRTFQETFYAGDVNLRELGQRCSAFWEANLESAHAQLAGDGGETSAHVK